MSGTLRWNLSGLLELLIQEKCIHLCIYSLNCAISFTCCVIWSKNVNCLCKVKMWSPKLQSLRFWLCLTFFTSEIFGLSLKNYQIWHIPKSTSDSEICAIASKKTAVNVCEWSSEYFEESCSFRKQENSCLIIFELCSTKRLHSKLAKREL